MSDRILVIANKTWEAAPLVAALFGKRTRPDVVHPMARVYDPDIAPLSPTDLKPRAELSVEGGMQPAIVQVWCLEDCMDPGAGGSNTAEKMRVLPRIFDEATLQFGAPPDRRRSRSTAAP